MLPLSVLLVLGAVVALGPLAIDMYLPALPFLEIYFQTDSASIQLTLAAYFVGIALGQLIYGPISDRYGRRGPLLFGLIGFMGTSIGCAYAPNVEILILLRFLQAMTGCAGMVIIRAIVRDMFPPQEMARILSLLVLVMGVAPILAPSLGGLVLKFYDWRLLFWILGLFTMGCVIAVWRVVPESLPPERRQSVMSIASVLRNYRQLMSHRKFMGYALSGGIAQAGMFAYISASSFVFINNYGFTPNEFAALFGANAFGLILASQLNRSLLQRVAAQRVLGYAIGVYALSGFVMSALALGEIGGIYGVTVPLWVCISALGFTFPNSTAAAMAPFGDRAGYASALLGTMQFTVAGIASATVGHFSAQGALPMAIVFAACGTMSWLLLRWVRDS